MVAGGGETLQARVCSVVRVIPMQGTQADRVPRQESQEVRGANVLQVSLMGLASEVRKSQLSAGLHLLTL